MNETASFAAARTESGGALPQILLTGVAMCFIGHGAFGLMTKQGWVPYFGVVGITEPMALKLMPWVGTMDVAIGFLAFVWPSRALFAWAAFWATWTALLRPLAGQGWPEFFERTGNYGVPLAILAAVGLKGSWSSRLPEHWPELTSHDRRRLIWTLRLAAASLLAGHATCALILQKPSLVHHYSALGIASPFSLMVAVGWFELLLAVVVLVVKSPAVFGFVCLWKFITEALFLTSGAMTPVFEVIERGGSYIVPLALVYLLAQSDTKITLPKLQPA